MANLATSGAGLLLGIQGNPNQQMAVETACQWISELAVFQRHLPDSVADLPQPGSELQQLLAALPRGPVTLDHTTWEGLWIAQQCLTEIGDFARGEKAMSVPTVMIMLRAALLAASRIVYALTPNAQPDRQDRALNVMRQEARSLTRLYVDSAKLDGVIESLPPTPDRDRQEGMAAELGTGRTLGEAAMLREMARVVAEDHAFAHPDPANAGQSDWEPDLLWIFNVYSGVAHGFAWPQLMWTVGSFPTNFPGDLMLTALVAHRAHQLAFEVCGLKPPDWETTHTFGATNSSTTTADQPAPLPRAERRRRSRGERRRGAK